MNIRNYILLPLAVLTALVIVSGYSGTKLSQKADTDTSLVIPAGKSIANMRIEEGFEIQLVASEPLVSAPVAMNFDNSGRLWVVEMDGYMTDVDGSEENRRSGKIVILEDRNKDGVMDDRKIFLDSLVLPRALCLIENGVLVAEPPRLWFVERNNDKAGKKILVDDSYTEGGNVEAQANGLYRALDNWIYSGGSYKRYRKAGDKWLIERTHLRGQWGVSQDDAGRLYYNNNSQNLLGDYFVAGVGADNDNLQKVNGFNERIVPDNRVYPGWPTPGVNRGYKENILDSQKRLVSFTAACGPVLYRGNLFEKAYYNNAFVAEPAANLIKRNILSSSGFVTAGKQAYEGKEFLVSRDERFRPVSLYNGPDGALYVVDMYRGIIQHKSFLTEYLKGEIQSRSLSQPVNCGRIYRIVPKGKKVAVFNAPDNSAALVALLKSTNGWIRDQAQQTIIDRKLVSAEALLRKMLAGESGELAAVHALWTLEGLGKLQSADILTLLRKPGRNIKIQALAAMPVTITAQTVAGYTPVYRQLIASSDTVLAPYLAFQSGKFVRVDPKLTDSFLRELIARHAGSPYVTDAIITNLKGREQAFYKEIAHGRTDTNKVIFALLRKVIADVRSNEQNRDANLLRKEFPRGASVFRTICQPCHGADGNGVPMLAPPLNRSEWVTGDAETLVAIILHGLTGPVTVNNKVYKAPEINGDMPGIGSNRDIVDEDIAQLSSFIRRSWNNDATKVSREDVIAIRRKFAGRQGAFTEKELKK